MQVVAPLERRVEAVPAGLTVEIVGDDAGLRALAGEWDELFRACEGPSLCALHAWVVAWWEAFADKAEGTGAEVAPYVVLMRDDERRLVAAFPLYEERPRNPLRVRRLRAMGFLGREHADSMTEEPTSLVRTDCEAAALRRLVDTLRPHLRRGRWDMAVLRHLERSPRPELHEAVRTLKPGCLALCDRATGPYLAELPPSWAEYRKALTKSMRDNLGYYPRLLARDGHAAQVRTIREPAEIPAAVARLVELHRARATQGRGVEHFDHLEGPLQVEFLRNLMARLAAEERGFVAELVVGEETVASGAFVESGDELMVYYSGYREAWYRYSPIFVIDAHVFREALERGVRRLDFLRVAGLWKSRWGADDCVPMDRAFVLPLRPLGLLRVGLYLTGVTIKKDVVGRVPVIVERIALRLKKLRSSS